MQQETNNKKRPLTQTVKDEVIKECIESLKSLRSGVNRVQALVNKLRDN